MTFPVIITPNAEQDLLQAYRHIRKDAPAAAGQWIKAVRSSIKTLANNPHRCPLAPESVSSENQSASYSLARATAALTEFSSSSLKTHSTSCMYATDRVTNFDLRNKRTR
jgi:plasmid stabilization system protein ParE